MALSEDPRFNRALFDLSPGVLHAILGDCRQMLNGTPWTYCGYVPIAASDLFEAPANEIHQSVDGGFHLWPACGFEQVPVVVTTGLRTSRFAPILFWEVLHTLTPGGLWIDIDESHRCGGTPLTAEDFPARHYFRDCLQPQSRQARGPLLVQTFRKICATPLTQHIADRSWTFGILTAGRSPRAAQMARAILALNLPEVEVIICGPRPSGVPDDRVRTIDTEQPEPRGWITRKKNLLAESARHDNLCLLHDRYVVTPEWADALNGYSPVYAFLTCPQVYYADTARRFPQRYPDYQVLHQRTGLGPALDTNIYDTDHVFHPSYEDFAETAFCCGGLYIARRCLWNRVRQDETLYHSEWEDISFGLECQRRGLPHRVNARLTVESVAAHPLLLTRRHDLRSPDRPERRRLHVSAAQATAAHEEPHTFKPVMPLTRERYYAQVQHRFNLTAGRKPEHQLTDEAIGSCRGLADFWSAIDRHIQRLHLTTRDEIAQLGFFLSDTIYKWPACQVLSWTRAHEDALVRHDPPAPHRFAPLADMVSHFEEVERYYPALFTEPGGAAA